MFKKLILPVLILFLLSCNSDNDTPINDDSSNNPLLQKFWSVKLLNIQIKELR